ncbi:TetR/AcrR family transcriptional regulator [Nocardia rhamnosiphila]
MASVAAPGIVRLVVVFGPAPFSDLGLPGGGRAGPGRRCRAGPTNRSIHFGYEQSCAPCHYLSMAFPEFPETPGPDAATSELAETLAIRQPRQKRSREAWQRVLEAGIALLESGGYGGFTIAALSETSGINPRAIYERASSKEALFLAVYEHKMTQMAADRDHLFQDTQEPGLPPGEVIGRAVAAVLLLFDRNAEFLRPVIAMAPEHRVIFERGKRHTALTGDMFVASMERTGLLTGDSLPAWQAFRAVYAMAVLRTMQGADFISPAPTLDEEIASSTAMVEQYLRAGHLGD